MKTLIYLLSALMLAFAGCNNQEEVTKVTVPFSTKDGTHVYILNSTEINNEPSTVPAFPASHITFLTDGSFLIFNDAQTRDEIEGHWTIQTSDMSRTLKLKLPSRDTLSFDLRMGTKGNLHLEELKNGDLIRHVFIGRGE